MWIHLEEYKTNNNCVLLDIYVDPLIRMQNKQTNNICAVGLI